MKKLDELEKLCDVVAHVNSIPDYIVLRLINTIREQHEALRVALLWGEAMSMRVTNDRDQMNYRSFTRSKAVWVNTMETWSKNNVQGTSDNNKSDLLKGHIR